MRGSAPSPAAGLFTASRGPRKSPPQDKIPGLWAGRGLPGELLEEVFAGPLLQPLGAISHQLPGNLRDEVRTLEMGNKQVSAGGSLGPLPTPRAEMANILGLC